MIVKQLEVRGQLRQIFGYSTVSTHVEIHTNRHRSFIQTDTEYSLAGGKPYVLRGGINGSGGALDSLAWRYAPKSLSHRRQCRLQQLYIVASNM